MSPAGLAAVGDVVVQDLGLGLEVAHPVLDDVADADDAGQPAARRRPGRGGCAARSSGAISCSTVVPGSQVNDLARHDRRHRLAERRRPRSASARTMSRSDTIPSIAAPVAGHDDRADAVLGEQGRHRSTAVVRGDGHDVRALCLRGVRSPASLPPCGVACPTPIVRRLTAADAGQRRSAPTATRAPPSTTRVWPVIHEARSLARNSAALAMSSGSPSRAERHAPGDGLLVAPPTGPGPCRSSPGRARWR